MKQYEAPVLTVEEIKTVDVIASSVNENEDGWLGDWGSVLG